MISQNDILSLRATTRNRRKALHHLTSLVDQSRDDGSLSSCFSETSSVILRRGKPRYGKIPREIFIDSNRMKNKNSANLSLCSQNEVFIANNLASFFRGSEISDCKSDRKFDETIVLGSFSSRSPRILKDELSRIRERKNEGNSLDVSRVVNRIGRFKGQYIQADSCQQTIETYKTDHYLLSVSKHSKSATMKNFRSLFLSRDERSFGSLSKEFRLPKHFKLKPKKEPFASSDHSFRNIQSQHSKVIPLLPIL